MWLSWLVSCADRKDSNGNERQGVVCEGQRVVRGCAWLLSGKEIVCDGR